MKTEINKLLNKIFPEVLCSSRDSYEFKNLGPKSPLVSLFSPLNDVVNH